MSQNNSCPSCLPWGAFHCGDRPVHKAYSYMLGFGLGNKKPLCASYYVFLLIYFLGWAFGPQANAKGPGWPLLPIRACLLVWSLPAEAQGRAPHQLRNSSVGPLLGSRTPPQMGKGQHSQWSTGGNKLFCVWKMPNQIWGIWKNHKNTPRSWILFLLYNKKYRRFNRP